MQESSDDVVQRTLANATQDESTIDLGPLSQTDTQQLLRVLVSELGTEQLLKTLLANLEGNGLDVETRPKPRPMNEDEREEFRRYLRGEGLSKRYTYETMKCVRQLERPEDSQFTGPLPPPVPCIHVREQDWVDRRAFELDWWDGSGTNNRRKALKHVCRWQDQAVWQSLEGRIPPAKKRKRPTPTREVVARLTAPQDDPTYRDRAFRHVAHFLAHTGRRISEARDLRVSDVDWDALDVYLWSEKHDDYRPMRYEPFVISAPNGPSLKHYVDHVRPEPNAGSEDALFLTRAGDRWTYHGLRTKLSKWGKQVWPQFYPHSLRKFAATVLLIENDYDLKRTALRLGIRAQTVEDHYLDDAMIRDQMGTDFTMPRVRGGTPR